MKATIQKQAGGTVSIGTTSVRQMVDGLADGAGKLGEAVGSEENQGDDQDEEEFRPADIEHGCIIS